MIFWSSYQRTKPLRNPSSIIDKYVYGVTRTKSGKGRPDVVIQSNNIYHVYEIKSNQYLTLGHYYQSAFNQLESYITTLRSGNKKNATSFPKGKTAIKGTVLDWRNGIYLPYIPDDSKMIKAWTKKGSPGMIFYSIVKKRKKDKLTSTAFVTQDLRDKISYYTELVCAYAPSLATSYVNVVRIQTGILIMILKNGSIL